MKTNIDIVKEIERNLLADDVDKARGVWKAAIIEYRQTQQDKVDCCGSADDEDEFDTAIMVAKAQKEYAFVNYQKALAAWRAAK